MLFVDYSSTFNTILPNSLAVKLNNLGINSHLCNWVLDFVSTRAQTVCIMGKQLSSSMT